ncbi:MAG TPA: hypothetical protein VNH83_28215 [Bryobacteraceae bacterium]|nr:hypothetical protein [Bryobacteraceae bacterium]
MKNQQTIAGEQRANRRAELPARAMQQSDREWWEKLLAEHLEGSCEECKRMKRERAERTSIA